MNTKQLISMLQSRIDKRTGSIKEDWKYVSECKGIRFTMGSGFDDVGREEVWNNQDKYMGKLAKFKYFAVGMLNSYRFPTFCGWRDFDDTSEG